MTYDNSCRNNLSEVKVEIKEDAVKRKTRIPEDKPNNCDKCDRELTQIKIQKQAPWMNRQQDDQDYLLVHSFHSFEVIIAKNRTSEIPRSNCYNSMRSI